VKLRPVLGRAELVKPMGAEERAASGSYRQTARPADGKGGNSRRVKGVIERRSA